MSTPAAQPGIPLAGRALHPPRPAIAIVPVKELTRAKSRLSPTIDVADRRALMLAMLADVLMNLRRCAAISKVFVVTDDREARHRAIAEGADVIPDDAAASHSEAALRGIAAAATPTDRVLLAPADCPLVTVEDLDALLALALPQPSAVIVGDRHGTGTNALLLDPPDAIEPAFGEGSLARHLELAAAAGIVGLSHTVPSLALDIDTPDDLATLRLKFQTARGGAPATRGVIATIRG